MAQGRSVLRYVLVALVIGCVLVGVGPSRGFEIGGRRTFAGNSGFDGGEPVGVWGWAVF